MGIFPDKTSTAESNDFLAEIIDFAYKEAVGEMAICYDDEISSRLDILKKMPDQEKKEISLSKKIDAFMQMLQNRKISGNEAIIMLLNMNKNYSFFSKDIKISFIWEKNTNKTADRRNVGAERICVLQNKEDDRIYLINFGNMICIEESKELFKRKIEDGSYEYENSDYQINID